jgi:hypothetical protein
LNHQAASTRNIFTLTFSLCGKFHEKRGEEPAAAGCGKL